MFEQQMALCLTENMHLLYLLSSCQGLFCPTSTLTGKPYFSCSSNFLSSPQAHKCTKVCIEAAFFLFSFFAKHYKVRGAFHNSWTSFIAKSGGCEMAVCKLAQVVHPPFRHWSARITSRDLAADWPAGVRRCELRGACMCFLGGFLTCSNLGRDSLG